MSRAILLAVACAACGGGKTEQPSEERAEIPCDDVAQHAAKLYDSDATWFASLCEDGWTRTRRACVRAAATKRELDDCGLVLPPQVIVSDEVRVASTRSPLAARVALTVSGDVFVNGDRVAEDQLDRRLASIPKDTSVVVAADKAAPYANVVKLMDRIQAAGLTKMSLEAAAP